MQVSFRKVVSEAAVHHEDFEKNVLRKCGCLGRIVVSVCALRSKHLNMNLELTALC